MASFIKDESEIGALWVKTSAKGEYLSGVINGVNVVCFRQNKKSERHPDWKVLKSKPRDGSQPPSATPSSRLDERTDDSDIGF